MNAPTPLFDRYHHRYSVAGRVVPGVTEVLAPLCDLSRIPLPTLRAAAAYGTAVHKACELDDLGELHEESLDGALAAPLAAWRAFCRDHAVRWQLVEAPLYNPTFGYAGTVDRFGLVGGQEAVVDIKTGTTLYPSVGPQLAAYDKAIALTPANPRQPGVAEHVAAGVRAASLPNSLPNSLPASLPTSTPTGTTARRRRYAVQLKSNGRYQVYEYRSADDWAVFASLLTLRNFCQTHRITPNFKERL